MVTKQCIDLLFLYLACYRQIIDFRSAVLVLDSFNLEANTADIESITEIQKPEAS